MSSSEYPEEGGHPSSEGVGGNFSHFVVYVFAKMQFQYLVELCTCQRSSSFIAEKRRVLVYRFGHRKPFLQGFYRAQRTFRLVNIDY